MGTFPFLQEAKDGMMDFADSTLNACLWQPTLIRKRKNRFLKRGGEKERWVFFFRIAVCGVFAYKQM